MKTLFNIGDKITAGDIASYIFDTIRPVAGYSLRKLSNISGPVIRARRGIDNKESDFYADEIEGGELQGFATGDGASDVFVTTWYDQFGNNNATQTTAAEQPKIWDASTGLVTENGKAALDFDGVNDYLNVGNIGTSTNKSVFGVSSLTGSSTKPQIGFTDGTEDYVPTIYIDNNVNYRNVTQVAYQVTLKNTSDKGFWSVTFTPSLLKGSINGIYYGETNLPSFFFSHLRIGARGLNGWTNYFLGKYQELIIYSSDQSANRETIETNINQYYIIFGPLRYNQRITEDSGTFALTDRYEAIYDEVTEIATPSLLCTCDAYKESTLTTYGTLYNIIPT